MTTSFEDYLTYQSIQLIDLKPIPLKQNGKRPSCNAWQRRPYVEQWEEVGDRFDGNIGLVLGNRVVVIDCDDQVATDHILDWLFGLGLRPPIVRTPSGGCHVYLLVAGVPASFTFSPLSASVGRGELRARNCYVVAPCSSIDGVKYVFIQGSILELPGLWELTWPEVAWMARQPAPGVRRPAPIRPVTLAWRCVRPEVIAQLQGLRDWPVGTPYGRFPSASEAEQSVICSMILAGWSFTQAKRAFDKEQPGAYMRRGDRRYNYLKLSYNNALEELATTLPRPELAAAYVELALCDLPTYERKALRALLALCWAKDDPAWQVSASVRQLGEQAGCADSTMYHALQNLRVGGLLGYILDGSGVGRFDLSRLYKGENRVKEVLLSTNSNIRHKGGLKGESPVGPGKDVKVTKQAVPRAAGARGLENLPGGQELWSAGLLGDAAEQVYACLTTTPQSAAELAGLTGKGVRTCERALKHLQVYGLSVGTGRPALWVRGPRSLADVARELDAPGVARVRRERHEKDRKRYKHGKFSTETRTTNDSKQLQVMALGLAA
jgi:Bifunctional DNA primase/polymerase, N-terminal